MVQNFGEEALFCFRQVVEKLFRQRRWVWHRRGKLPKTRLFSLWTFAASGNSAVAESGEQIFSFQISVAAVWFHCWILNCICRKRLCVREWGNEPSGGGSALHNLLLHKSDWEQISFSEGDGLQKQWSG